MDEKKSKRLLAALALIYWVIALVIFFVAGEQFHVLEAKGELLSASSAIELTDERSVTQKITVQQDEIQTIELMMGVFIPEHPGMLKIMLLDEDGNTLAQKEVPLSEFPNAKYTSVLLEPAVEGQRNRSVTLQLDTQGCVPGQTVTIYTGTSVNVGRFDIDRKVSDEECYRIDGEVGAGLLCVRFTGVQWLNAYKYYWPVVAGIFAGMSLYAAYCWKKGQQGKTNLVTLLCTVYTRYGFLIRQLVSRNFKMKYRRSTLGIFWSLLNPLLMMAVQYVVFSTLFQSDIPHFPIYLLSGITFFNFFNEAVNMGMTSITGNASLIKKVYIPKYIYPATSVVSSLINFGLSMLPVFVLMPIMGIAFRPSLLLLFFDIACLVAFVLGMSLLLSASMTFFRDTQFLWSVISLIWTYLTPIFYPETIIAVNMRPLYRMNPMYQFITFARTCIIDGVSPAPIAYVGCMLSAFLVLGLGMIIFRKNQDRFVLYV